MITKSKKQLYMLNHIRVGSQKFKNSYIAYHLSWKKIYTLHMLNEIRMNKTEVKVIFHITDLTKCSRPYKPNEPKVLIKKTTT